MSELSATTSSLSKRKKEKINSEADHEEIVEKNHQKKKRKENIPRAEHEEVVQFIGDIGERTDRQHIWYFFDVKHGKIIKTVKFPEYVPFTSTPVSCLNHIYLLGGDNERCYDEPSFPNKKDFFPTSVVRLDLDNIEKGWTDAPSMLFGTTFSPYTSVVAFEGKVYVLGGHRALFGEVFDIVEDSWAELKPPFDYFRASPPVLLDSSRSRILVHCRLNNSLYAYNVADETWDCLDENYGERWSDNSVIVDGVIYSLVDVVDKHYHPLSDKSCSLRAYGVDEKKKLDVSCLLSGNETLVVTHNARLYHLGNHKLCLVGHDSFKKGCIIQCFKFSVCKWKDSGAVCVFRDPGAAELLQSIELKGSFWKFV